MIGVTIAILAAAAPSVTDHRSLPEALDLAIDYCSATASGERVQLNGRIANFVYADGPMADLMRAKGFKTTADAPQLILRFADTARYSSIVGHRSITAIEASDGIVWLVSTSNSRLCDIAITGIDDAETIPASVSKAVTENSGWQILEQHNDGSLWMSSFEKRLDTEGQEQVQAQIRATGLGVSLADPAGIQAEINFAASDTSSLAAGNN